MIEKIFCGRILALLTIFPLLITIIFVKVVKNLTFYLLLTFAVSLWSFNIKQYVTFTPPQKGTEGSALNFTLIYSGPVEVDFILYYRSGNEKGYKTIQFSRGEFGKYTAVLPSFEVQTPGIYFYIEAIDRENNSYSMAGSYAHPLYVPVEKRKEKIFLPEVGKEFSPLEEELTLLQAENVVYTASAFAQSILESPASIVSISSDYIELLGSKDIGEILRWLPGIDVIKFTPADIQIGVRGFNREITNKLLTMVDGRSVYFDFFGFTSFSSLPISIFDIAKIEVVKGPVSAIYGANAWSGVINIITRDPRKEQGLRFYFGMGYNGAGECKNFKKGFLCLRNNYGNYQYATYKDKQYVRISAGWENRSDFEHPARLSTPELFAEDREKVRNRIGKGNEKIYANSTFGYEFSSSFNLKVQSGFSLIKGNILTELSQYGTEGNTGFIKSEVTYKMFQAVLFWNHLNSLSATFFRPDTSDLTGYMGDPLDVEPLVMNKHIINDVYDITLKQRVLASPHKLSFGAGYRFNRVDAPHFFRGKVHQQNLFNAFLLDEVKFGSPRNWIVNGAIRYDHHPLTGDHLSPRLALVYKINDEQGLRFSASRAFRNPTFIESYMDFEVPTVLAVAPGGEVLEPPQFVVSPVKARVVGNRNLESEVIDGFDFTYQWLKENVIHLTLDGFYNRFYNLIRYQTTPEGKSFTNLGKGYEYGGEVGLRWYLSSYFELWSNYSYQRIYNTNDDPETLQDEKGVDPRFPQHKFNLVLFAKFNKFKSSFQFHYESKKGKYFDDDFIPYKLPAVDPQKVGDNIVGYVVVSPDTYYEIPAFYIVNLNFLYDISKHFQIGVYVYNLLNYVHKEFPRPEAEDIGRIIYGNLRVVF